MRCLAPLTVAATLFSFACSNSSGQTAGVDFDESTNGLLSNAFLYTGDDGMAPKNEDPSGTINSKNLTHQHIVVYNNSVGCKIGTKSMGQSMGTRSCSTTST